MVRYCLILLLIFTTSFAYGARTGSRSSVIGAGSGVFLRLDCSNDPLTGDLDINDDLFLNFGNTADATMEWDNTSASFITTVSGSSSVTMTHNTETHRITNFIFKPIGSGITWSNYAYGAAANLNFFRANGTEGAETSINNGAILNRSLVWGYHTDGSAYIQGAEQRYTVDAAIGGTAEIPTRWELYLTPDGGTTPVEVLQMDNDGDMTIGSGVAGKDYSIIFDGEDNDGILTWLEDEAAWDINGLIDADTTMTHLAGQVNAYDFDVSVAPTAPSAGYYVGITSNLTHTGGQNITGGMTGFIMQTTCDSVSTLSSSKAAQFTVSNKDAGTITNGIGITLSHFNSGGGTITNFWGMQFKYNNATNVYAFDFQGDGYVSNSRAVSCADDGVQRYIPLSTADTGITYDSTDLILATTTSGNIYIEPTGNVEIDLGVAAKFDIDNGDIDFEIIDYSLSATGDITITSTGAAEFDCGIIENTTRVTSSPYNVLVTDNVVFVDTDGGAITVNLPAGVEGTHYKIINCGSSTNNVTIDGNGAETVYGGATKTLADGEVVALNYNATEGWW